MEETMMVHLEFCSAEQYDTWNASRDPSPTQFPAGAAPEAAAGRRSTLTFRPT